MICADNSKKISHLLPLQSLGDLKIFKADLTDEEKFDAPIAGCDFVFHVATPVNFASEDPEVNSTLNLLFITKEEEKSRMHAQCVHSLQTREAFRSYMLDPYASF